MHQSGSTRTLLALTAVAILAAPAMAQQNSLVTEVANFYASDFFISPNSGGHEGHFNNNPFATSSLVTVMTSIASQATSYPIGSSSGGFTYVRDAEGLPVPASETFGR